MKVSAPDEVTTKDASLEFVVKTMEKSEVLLNQIMLFANSISNLHAAQKYLDYEVKFRLKIFNVMILAKYYLRTPCYYSPG